jgi:glucose-fructose oxidoreductase
MSERTWRIVGINFDHHGHMEGLLKTAHEHPRVEIAGISDEQPDRMEPVIKALALPRDRVFTDYRRCLETTRPDVAILCPATSRHAAWTEKVAPFGVHLIVEKPFAATLAEADRMIAAVKRTGKTLAINWPLRWYPVHMTTKRLIDEGTIGEPLEVHYYDGNRGPAALDPAVFGSPPIPRSAWKEKSWFYRRADGGGSLLDYLGYGTTLGTWFLGGKAPIEVTAVVDKHPDLEVDEHAVVIARYVTGLSRYETRWGTFTSPWEKQPQPKCGFVVVGREGTIGSYDYEPSVRVQTRQREEAHDVPVDVSAAPYRNPVEYVLDCLESGRPVEGPLAPSIARIGQQIVDGAQESVRRRRPVSLPR